VHIKQGTVIYYTSSFVLGSSFTGSSSVPDVKANDGTLFRRGSNSIICESEAVRIGEELLGIKKDNVPILLRFVQGPNGLVYAYTFQVRNDTNTQWFQVSVNAMTGF
jgi:hypothetical protein